MSGRIPREFIDDLLARVDIVDVVDTRVPLKKRGREHIACCPFHEEKTPSFTVSQTKQFYHCFGCGAHGSAIGFLMEHEGLGFVEAVRELAQTVGLELPQGSADSPSNEQVPALLEVLTRADRWFRDQLRAHPRAAEAQDYLKGRGLTGQTAARFGIGFAPEGWDNLLRALDAEPELLLGAGLVIKKDSGGFYDRFRHRVLFPIHDYRGRVVAFGGRVLGEGEPKYLNSPETAVFHKGRELYGLYLARDAIRASGQVLIVEGYMDVVALSQHGVENVVATLGTATTRYHLERIFRFAPEVVFCFDGDRAGREAAVRALETALPLLSEGRQAGFLFLPEGEDPDSLVRREGGDAFRARLANSVPLPEFLFDHLRQQADLSRMDGRARYAELARPLIGQVPDGILKRMMTERLGELTRLGDDALRGLVAAAPRQASGSDRVRRPRPLQGDSPVRKAVALLVQQPDLAASVADQPELPEAAIAGLDLLRGLLKLLQEAPKQNTGQVLEHYRGDPSEKHLEKLATWEHAQQASDNPQGELRDALLAVRIDALQRQEAAARELGDARAAEICAALQQEISRLKQQRLSGGG